MAIRRRQVYPDAMLTLRSGEQIAVVSDEAFLAALEEVGRFACFAGGTINATTLRQRTDLEGEAVTIGAVIEWKDRTDARAQPEPVVESAPAPALSTPEQRDAIANAHLDLAMQLQQGSPPPNGHHEPPDKFETQETPAVTTADAALAQVDAALGMGSGALPFQRGSEEQRIAEDIERVAESEAVGSGSRTSGPPAPPIQQRVAHEEGSHYTPVGPAPGVADDEVQDGLTVVDHEAVDDSDVPEHLR